MRRSERHSKKPSSSVVAEEETVTLRSHGIKIESNVTSSNDHGTRGHRAGSSNASNAMKKTEKAIEKPQIRNTAQGPTGNALKNGTKLVSVVKTADKATLDTGINALEIVDSPSFNPLVLERVIGFLGFRSIKKCRLVNRAWNEEASRLLAERSYISLRRYRTSASSCRCDNDDSEDEDGEMISHAQTFMKTLKKSLHPEKIFASLMTDWSYLNQLLQMNMLFDGFGKHLRILKLTSNSMCPMGILQAEVEKYIAVVTKILKVSCPNLESLTLIGFIDNPDEFDGHGNDTDNGFLDISNFEAIEPKHLKILEIVGTFKTPLRKFVVSLLKTCPGLKKLIVSEGHKQELLFKDIAEVPQITSKLTELEVETDGDFESVEHVNIPEWISKLTFSKNLKVIRLNGCIEIEHFGRQSYHIIPLLESVSGSLELLEISDIIDQAGSEQAEDPLKEYQPRKEIPKMEKLRTLNIGARNLYGFESISVLQKFPSLEVFCAKFEYTSNRIPGFWHWDDIPECNPSLIDKFVMDWECFNEIPHLTLRRLHLTDRNLTDQNFFNGIPLSFPNLQFFHVGIRGRNMKDRLPSDLSTEVAVQVASELKKLEEFTLFHSQESSPAEVHRILSSLNNFEKLQRFSLTDRKCAGKVVLSHLEKNLEEMWMSESGKKVRVCLYGYDITEKKDNIKLNNYMSDNGITSFHFQMHPSVRKQNYQEAFGPRNGQR